MKRWKILNKNHASDPENIIKILLANRGIKSKKEVDEFLNPKLENATIEKAGIDKKEVKKTIDRINKAIKNGEKIIIYGDYDVDGICGSAILWETIYRVYKNVLPYIPNRINEGYGLSIKGIENCKLPSTRAQAEGKNENCKLIITVDNGIVANEAVDYANKQGIDVIITDHHVLPKILPKAYSIVHTTQVCGAGIAYLLSQEISNKNTEEKTEENHLELVALATIADLVPLIGANRTLVKFGLKALSQTKRPGLLALLEIAGINNKELGTYEVGYILGPRLNAMGRLFDAMDSLRLICTKNKGKARLHAENLNISNRERQNLTEETTIHAKSIYSSTSSKIVFIYHEEYNQGIIGLVASKLVEEYYKPAFVLSVGKELSKGSARSIRDVDIIELIRSAGADLLVDAGGHPMAAGFTIKTDKIKEFQNALEKKADEMIDETLLKRTIIADLILDLNNINFDLYNKIQDLAPFGIGNPEPAFVSEKVLIEDMRLVGNGGKHLKFNLKFQKANIKFDAIAFGMGDKTNELHIGDNIDILYTINEDKWLAPRSFSEVGNGNKKLQLKIKDIKVNPIS